MNGIIFQRYRKAESKTGSRSGFGLEKDGTRIKTIRESETEEPHVQFQK